jgi:hypothetical protein
MDDPLQAVTETGDELGGGELAVEQGRKATSIGGCVAAAELAADGIAAKCSQPESSPKRRRA